MRFLDLAMLTLAVFAAGCGPKAPKGANQPVMCPPGQFYDGRFCVTQGTPTGTPTATPTATPTGTATATPTATPTGTAAGDPTTALAQLPALVQAHVASGAQPLGAPATGSVGPGVNLEVNVQLEPGRCYTALGASGPGVQELEVSLVLVSPIPGTAPVLAVDKDQGPTAAMAPQPNCHQHILPAMPGKIIVKALTGSGAAAVQVFAK